MEKSVICNSEADYSEVVGDRILPFVFSLNLEASILYPAPGQYQTFCYDVEGVGQDTSQYADLSHFLLGICSSIAQEDIVDVLVVVNGISQTVVWGENVEIKTTEQPDNPTGCVGLKFDFPLNKVGGTMHVCISLRRPYAIGPANVCVFGGNTTATGLAVCGPSCGNVEPCESVFYQKETVCVPVTVTPFANPGEAKATCCGEAIVNMGDQCPGNRRSCAFTITQNLCIEIPISFGAVIETGAAVVQCGDVSEEECDCGEPEEPAEMSVRNTTDMRERRLFGR